MTNKILIILECYQWS